MWLVTFHKCSYGTRYSLTWIDAYTYLGLQSNNEYNIKASMYSSKDFFDIKHGVGKQTKLENLLYKEKKDVGEYRRVHME